MFREHAELTRLRRPEADWVTLRVWGILVALLLLVGCRSIHVQSDWDPEISFDALRTFGWLEPPKVEGADPFADNTLLRKRLRHAIEAGLVARGYRMGATPERADFLVTYSVILNERIEDDGPAVVGYRGFGRRGIYGADVGRGLRNYQESTLVIDVVGPASKELIWRGWGSGVVGTRDRQRSEARLEEGVSEILQAFPPDGA